MPKDEAIGLIEPDIVINGHALTFQEAMAVRVVVSSMRLLLSEADYRAGIGRALADAYDHHLKRVEHAMLNRARATLGLAGHDFTY